MILDLNPVDLVTPRQVETRDFFVGVLGLNEGPGPDFPFKGHWPVAGETAPAHLMSLGGTPSGRGASRPLDHAAVEVVDPNAAKRHPDEHGVGFREAVVSPGRGQRFLRDPDGVRIGLGGPVG